MSEPFFITGLPRSRTAWMAVAMTASRTFCRHEPRYDSVRDLKDLWYSNYYQYVGISDSGLGLKLQWIMDEIKPRVLIIDRAIEDVIRSGAKLGVHNRKYIEDLYSAIAPFRFHPNTRIVNFEDLDDLNIIRSIHKHLMPHAFFYDEHVKQLMHMNIQVSLDYIKERIK